MLEAILKDGMTRWAQNQAPKHGHAQDFNWMQWQFENNYEMNVHAHFLKWSLENNLILFLITIQGWDGSLNSCK
jgi:hypothetical protein